MNYETLLISTEKQIATITLNRPKVLNALNAPMLRELDSAFLSLSADDQIRTVILNAAGGKAFAAGADIGELAQAGSETGEQIARSAQRVFRQIETMGKPVIACIEGFALGGGCELAMACKLRIASESARFGQPEIKLGLIPGYGGTQRLPRLVGRGAALKMLLTGGMIDASEALRIGLVDEIAPDPMLRCQELAETIASMPPLAVSAIVEAVDRGADLPMDEALSLEAGIFGKLCGTDDKREGTSAFLEKRPAVWTGR